MEVGAMAEKESKLTKQVKVLAAAPLTLSTSCSKLSCVAFRTHTMPGACLCRRGLAAASSNLPRGWAQLSRSAGALMGVLMLSFGCIPFTVLLWW